MDRSEGYKPRMAAGPDVCVPSRREAARREQARRDNGAILGDSLKSRPVSAISLYPLSAAFWRRTGQVVGALTAQPIGAVIYADQ